MGFVSNMPDDDYRAATVGMNQPATPFVPGMFTGTLDALEKGVVGAVGKMGKTLTMLGDYQGAANAGQYGWAQSLVPPSSAPPLTPVDTSQDPDFNGKRLQALQDWSAIDPRTHGPAAQVLGSTAQGLTIMGLGSLMGTPLAGAGALGVTEGSNDYADSTAAGIDQNTALAKAGLTGVASFAGAAVPMAVSSRVAMRLAGMGLSAEVAGNTALSSVFYGAGRAAATMAGTAAGKIATSGAAMVGFGAGNRFLTSHLLESAGYPEMAAQYKTLDAQAIVSDLVLGLAFGASGVLGEKLGERLNPLERPDPAQVEAALEGRKAEMRARGAAGLPTDPATAGLDAELSDRALGNMLRGREAGVTPMEAQLIVNHSLLDPERVQLHQDMTNAFRVVYGDLAETTPPPRSGWAELEGNVPDHLASRFAQDRATSEASVVRFQAEFDALESRAQAVQDRLRTQLPNIEGYEPTHADLAKALNAFPEVKREAQAIAAQQDIVEAKLNAAYAAQEQTLGRWRAFQEPVTELTAPKTGAEFTARYGMEPGQSAYPNEHTAEYRAARAAAKAEPPAPGAKPEAQSGLSPMADEQANQLAARHPDLDVQMPDGSTVKASQMPDMLREQMAKASQDSNLFTTAVGCFLRTML